MTIFVPNPNVSTTSTGMPGAQPVPGAGNQMQGNPNPNAGIDLRTYPPAPQAGGAAQTLSTPLVNHLISSGLIPLNADPISTVSHQPGTDSLLAQMSRGQVMLNQSTYGQGGLIPANAGQSPQTPQDKQSPTQPVATGAAGGLSFATPCNYTGN